MLRVRDNAAPLVCVLATRSVIMQQHWPAPERNKIPILEVLKQTLPSAGRLLEVASGSGQHAAYFAAALPAWTWLPSDIDPGNLASIAAYVDEAALPNLAAPRHLDVCAQDWQIGVLDAVFNANMIHIAPWAVCEGLLRGAGQHLRDAGLLVLYGPFRIGGAHTAPSNAEFDASLRKRDAQWGVRDLEAVVELACTFELTHRAAIAMPANNQCLIFARNPRA
jgi:SAM-dependent methyltransferase